MLHLTSTQQAPARLIYRVFPVPYNGYEVVECEQGRSDRPLARFLKYDDAVMIAEALNRSYARE